MTPPKALSFCVDAGCRTFVQARGEATVPQAPEAAIAMEAAEKELPVAQLGADIIACCSAV